MTPHATELMDAVRRDLAAWHAINPTATFADMELVVEEHIQRLRAALLQERTEAARAEEYPACSQCGGTMVPRSRSSRTIVLPGEEPVPLERSYVVCPGCGTGLFPPG